MRGGLDDALEKLARRDELRRRAASEATGTPAAVTDLVEAIAAVVARHPRLGVTVGVEGDGDPMVLHFFFDEGQVQVTAENGVAAPPRADFDIEVGEPVEEFPPPEPVAAHRVSQDDQDRYGPPAYGYEQPAAAYYPESDTAERRYGSFEQPPPGYASPDPGETSRDLGARMRDLGMASSAPDGQGEFPPHPLAPTPPPHVPPQTTRRIDPQQYRAPAEPTAAERLRAERLQPERLHPERMASTERIVPSPPPEPRGMPTPLPEPIPLQVERPEETEMAARRLAALLRDDPTLLSQRPE